MFLIQEITEEDFLQVSGRNFVPDPRGVHLAILYTRSRLDFASRLAGNVVSGQKLMALYTSIDGVHFQDLYLRCKQAGSIKEEASLEEMNSIRPYFDLVTSNGTKVKL